MAGPLRVERDVGLARWVQESLSDFGSVAANVPPIFEAYARILHPATLETPTSQTDAWGNVQYAAREITWAEAAELIGDRVGEREPSTVWQSRFGDDSIDLPDGRRVFGAHGLDIPVPLLATLTELLLESHGDAEVLAAVWEGSGLDPRGSSVFLAFPEAASWWERRRETRRAQAEHRAEQTAAVDPEVLAAMRAQHVLGLPREQQGRGHVLLRAQLAAFADPSWVESAGLGWRADRPLEYRTPNAIWPVEPHGAPAWFVATDLDLDVTLIGGSAHLVGRVLGHPAIEAERIRPTDPVL
ncbi:hypothetical protein SAMN04487783_1236 [Agrococcus baldri]|uniref:Uncharacterized protein n=1 Tax=Agrococcus baldri TaxID=153730 RepID=A0AA94HM11_9MICO|nr:hypothetical protein [Agrococcus baldri]SFS09290.1 hypothetical protein SAMN04487783_1236 [Agrococcus baldri]